MAETVPKPPASLVPAEQGFVDTLSEAFTGAFTSDVPPPPDFLIPEEPTLGEKAGEIGMGMAEGAVRGTSTMAPALYGAKIGATMGAPFGPVGSAVGGTLGFGGGLTAGFLVSQGLGDLFPGSPREDLAPYRAGGTTFGESIAFAPIAFGIPTGMVSNKLARFLSSIGKSAREQPYSFATNTLLGATGAGTLGGMAEAYAPGQPGIRLGAEVLGGSLVMSPVKFMVNAAGTAWDAAKGAAGQFSEGSLQNKAAKVLMAAITEAGEDPDALIKALARETPIDPRTGMPIKPTAAQKTGSPILSTIENTLAQQHAKYSGQTKEQGVKAFQGYQLLVEKLNQIGTPDAIKAAADLQAQYFDGLVQGSLDIALDDASRSIARITKDTPAARREIGQIVRDNVEKSLKQARTIEKELWGNAYASAFRTTKEGETVARKVKVNNLVQSYVDRVAQINPALVNDLVPDPIRRLMKSMGVTDEVVSRYRMGFATPEFQETRTVPAEFLPKGIKPVEVMDLVNLRSNLLDLSRDSVGRGEFSKASLFGNMADEALTSLNRVDSPAYDKARSYSKSLNDTFTRSFASDVTAKDTSGAEKLPLELLVSKAFTTNADLTSLRMQEIEDAVGFFEKEQRRMAQEFGPRSAEALALQDLVPTSQELVASTRDAQSRALRLLAARYVNPESGELNTRGLTQWMGENQGLVQKMGLADDLENAVRAQNAVKASLDPNSASARAIRKQQAFAGLLEFGDPSRAVGQALKDKFPVKSLGSLVQVAKRGGPEAVDGLKHSVYDYAFNAATNAQTQKLNPTVLSQIMFKEISPGQPSLVKIMRSQGVMSLSEEKNLRRLINPMVRIDEAMRTGNKEALDDIIGQSSALTDLALRVAGSAGASAIAPGGPGSLIAAAAGSRFMRSIFDKMPRLSLTRVIEDATKDPELLAQLLQRTPTMTGQQLRLARQLGGYLMAAGYNYAAFEEPEPEEVAVPTTPTTGAPAAALLRQLPPAPPTRGLPFMSSAQAAQPAPAAPGPQPTAQGPGPAAPASSRQMLQSLFPFDTTLQVPQ